MSKDKFTYTDSALGKKTEYHMSYDPGLLFQIPRLEKRAEIGLSTQDLPFTGFDLWTHYEVSWLNSKGKPVAAIAEISYSSDSLYIVESKSLKLYFNSLNNTMFKSAERVSETIQKDLENIIQSPVQIHIKELQDINQAKIESSFNGECIDGLDVHCDKYIVEPSYLSTGENMVTEALYSDLLKSNCLVTNQPDWGSVFIEYTGKKIDRAGLLKYIVSFRNHNEFHEQCIERIFMDIFKRCAPQELSVYGRYTRRGGLDINPFRTNKTSYKTDVLDIRLVRQ